MIDYIPPIAFVFGLLTLAAFVVVRSFQSTQMPSTPKPSAEDRLRVALAVRLLEDAARELSKAAWVDNRPGHPAIGELLLDLREVEAHARRILRDS
jgi:hypothetical protein